MIRSFRHNAFVTQFHYTFVVCDKWCYMTWQKSGFKVFTSVNLQISFFYTCDLLMDEKYVSFKGHSRKSFFHKKKMMQFRWMISAHAEYLAGCFLVHLIARKICKWRLWSCKHILLTNNNAVSLWCWWRWLSWIMMECALHERRRDV